jgi:hypothetical protein
MPERIDGERTPGLLDLVRLLDASPLGDEVKTSKRRPFLV